MDVVLSFLVCLLLGAPIGLAGSLLIGRGPQLMSGLFGGLPPLGWPRGVQEEDPPGGWTWHLPPDDAADAPATAPQPDAAIVSEEPVLAADRPVLRPLKPQIRRGTSQVRPRW
jgi:hypothetical protein